MKKITEKWKKGKVEIDFLALVCECGGSIEEKGASGCEHGMWGYLYQCVKCKNVWLEDESMRIEDREQLKSNGWKLVK